MWDKICELFNEEPYCYVNFVANDKKYKIACDSKEEAYGFTNAIHMFDITDKSWITTK